MEAMSSYQQLRERAEERATGIEDEEKTISLQLSWCSMAAGAGDVLRRIEEVTKRLGIEGVQVKVVGCAGLCSWEPIMSVKIPGEKEVVYKLVTPERAELIILNHILRGIVIQPWLI